MSILNEFALATLDALSAHIALVNDQGEIVAVNRAWSDFAGENAARSNVSEGANYFVTCSNTRGKDADYANSFVDGLKAVLNGELGEFSLEYPCHAPSEQRWFIGRISRFSDGELNYAVVAHENITERKLAEQELYTLARETALQEERQRLSRELHDGVSQSLFSTMTLSQTIPRMIKTNPDKALQMLDQVVQLSSAALSEMRVLLLELRPESIVNTPLPGLLQKLVDSTMGRNPINAALKVEGDKFTLPPEVHFTFYRIAQEATNNIVKHSGASSFCVNLAYLHSEELRMCIHDNGQGFDIKQNSAGIGFNSMKERTKEVNADLEMTSAPGEGTQICLMWQAPDS